MEKLDSAINSINQELISARNSIVEREQAVNKDKAFYIERKQELKAQEEVLKLREENISSVENFLSLKADFEKNHVEFQSQKSNFNKAKEEFDKYSLNKEIELTKKGQELENLKDTYKKKIEIADAIKADYEARIQELKNSDFYKFINKK